LKNFIRVVIVIVLLSMVSPVHAGSDWEFNFFGISSKDFEGRSVPKILLGCAVSFATHEAGHYIMGEVLNMNPSLRWDDGLVVYSSDYYYESTSHQALYSAGGFVAQALVGTALTISDNTRWSDFTLGFTSFTFVNNTLYGITNGDGGEEYSDTENLNRLGYNGNAIAITAGLYSGMLSYINLKRPTKWTQIERSRNQKPTVTLNGVPIVDEYRPPAFIGVNADHPGLSPFPTFR
jgi:hypothetical protein